MKKVLVTILVSFIGMSFSANPAASEQNAIDVVRVVEALFTEQVQQGIVPSFSTTVNMTANLTASSIIGKIAGFYNGSAALFFCHGSPSSATVNTEYSYNFFGTINPENGAFIATILPSGVADILSGSCNGDSFGWSGSGTLSGTINTFTGEIEIKTNWAAGSAQTTGLWLGLSGTESGTDIVLVSEHSSFEVCNSRQRNIQSCQTINSGKQVSLSLNPNLFAKQVPDTLFIKCIDQANSTRYRAAVNLLLSSSENISGAEIDLFLNISAALFLNHCSQFKEARIKSQSPEHSNARTPFINFSISNSNLHLSTEGDDFPIEVTTPTSTVSTDKKSSFSILISEDDQDGVSILAFSGDIDITPKNSSLPPFTLNNGETTFVTTTKVGPIVQLQHIFLPITVR